MNPRQKADGSPSIHDVLGILGRTLEMPIAELINCGAEVQALPIAEGDASAFECREPPQNAVLRLCSPIDAVINSCLHPCHMANAS